jgi:predicted metal-dependent peptidase
MATTLSDNIFTKVRINFLFNHPFLSVLALSIPTTFEKNKNSAFETNGSKITIDMEKLELYSENELIYLYAHTLLHIVLKHPSRQGARDLYMWNAASNIVVNNILSTFSNIGTKPDDEITDIDLNDKCVEEVYDILYKEEEKEENKDGSEEQKESEAKTSPDKKGDKKANIYNPSKMDIDEVPNNKTDQGEMEKLDGIIIQALSIASKSSNQYAGMSIEIDTIIKPEISLEDTLKEYLIESLFEKQTTYEKANRKFIHSGLYLPGYKKAKEQIEIYIALDSSSSVSLDEYKKFLGIVTEICEGFYEYTITVIPFDKFVKKDNIIHFDSFNPLEDDAIFIPKSDGGTNFNEVVRYLKTTNIRGDNLLLVLTDGEFDISESPICQTLFIISNKKNSTRHEDFGRVIQFNL